MFIGDICPKCRRHKVINLPPRPVGQVPRGRVLDEVKLCPHDEVDDPGVYAVRRVVVEDPVVVLKLKGPAAGRHGGGPAQPPAEDEAGDAAVPLPEAGGEGHVAAQGGGQALEGLEAVGPDDLADLVPGEDVVLGVWGREDADVLGRDVLEKVGTLVRPLVLGDVVVPVLKSFRATHCRSYGMEREGEKKGEGG